MSRDEYVRRRDARIGDFVLRRLRPHPSTCVMLRNPDDLHLMHIVPPPGNVIAMHYRVTQAYNAWYYERLDKYGTQCWIDRGGRYSNGNLIPADAIEIIERRIEESRVRLYDVLFDAVQ